MIGFSFEALGTFWSIDLVEPGEECLEREVKNLAVAFEKRYSRFLPGSEISRINRGGVGERALSAELVEMLEFAQRLKRITDGAFEPNIAHILEGYGYDRNYSFKKDVIRLKKQAGEWRVKNGQLLVSGEVGLDLGGLGKGFLIDKIGEHLVKSGVKNFLIEGGGDLLGTSRARGAPWRLAVEHPLEEGKVIAKVKVVNGSLATSGGKYRRIGDFHHLIDVETKKSARRLLAVSVLAAKALVADAAATAIFVSKEGVAQRLADELGVEYLAIYPDMTFETNSDRFELF